MTCENFLDPADFMAKCVDNLKVKGQYYNVSSKDFVTSDGLAKLCAEAADKLEPSMVRLDSKLAGGMPESLSAA
eukprot:3412109-Heterocapsa_arctica.AAC.1